MNSQKTIANKIRTVVKRLWPKITLPEIEIVEPPRIDFGDYSSALPLQIAKEIKKKPLEIAQKIVQRLGKISGIAQITITEPGYINFILDYQALAKKLLKPGAGFRLPLPKPQRIIVEHTSVNPNKAAHVGHLRNAVLGDTVARLLKGVGHEVEVQNYIDDMGLQVADSVVAAEKYGDIPPEGWDYDGWFWKIYADIQRDYEKTPQLLKRREVILQELEKNEGEIAKFALNIANNIVLRHLTTFRHFGISYDLLVWERDIVECHLWKKVFSLLKKKKLIKKPASGTYKGAWIVEFGRSERENKILVKSDGLPTYTGKDLAYQFWKFGKIEDPFKYFKLDSTLTTAAGTYLQKKRETANRKFKKANKVINVIDLRQSYPQDVIRHILAKLGYKKEAENSVHLAYGVVNLSPATMKAIKAKVKKKKQAYPMSGREGIGVKIDDLFDTFISKLKSQNNEALASGAIRYYLLKSRPQSDITFDMDTALKTTGNTGVYLIYAYARASNILKKASKTTAKTSSQLPRELSAEGKNLLKKLEQFEETIKEAAIKLDPSLLCDYLYELSAVFAQFYENNPVIQSKGRARTFRLGLVKTFKNALGKGLELLGIPALPKI